MTTAQPTGRHHRAEHHEWHTDTFVPAAKGWRIVCLDERGNVGQHAMPGWLVQREVAYDGSCPEADGFQSANPIRRVVAATHVFGELVAVYDGATGPGFWRIAAPYDLPPSPQEIKTELERRAKIERAIAGLR